MIELRKYQKEAISKIKNGFQQFDSQYVEMPTGSGKTVTFLSYAQENHKRVLVIVPSKELLRQVYETALLFYDKNEISRKGNRFDESPETVHICIINSIRDKYLDFITDQYFDLVIIDEAHHIQSSSYIRLLDKLIFTPKILGATATPDRLDRKFINQILKNCCYNISINELIDQRYLSDLEGFRIKTEIDLSDIDDRNGDFNRIELYNKLCNDYRNNMIVDIYKNEMKNRNCLIFLINVNHSKEINKKLNLIGIPSAHIDGSMNSVQRSSIIQAFRNKEIHVLCNCQLLSEGFDEPSIDGIILARPTKSKSLFRQMIGRGLRINPGKVNCKVIDIVDNHKFLAGFNSLIENEKYREITSFKTIRDIQTHIGNERIRLSEFTLERADLLDHSPLSDLECVPSMQNYLDKENIYYEEPLSFDDGSFLIWKNELQKEFSYGNN